MSRDTSNSNATAEVIIVGGGIIGLAIARALSRRGLQSINVLERGQPGAEASWAGGGILAPQVEVDHADDFFRLACSSRDLYPSFAQALQDETGVNVELDTTGTLCVAFGVEQERELRHRYEWQRKEGLQVEWLSGNELRRLEPRLSESIECAIRLPNDYQVENRCLVKALLITNRKRGVTIRSKCEVTSLLIDKGRVCGVKTRNETLTAPIVILAAGSWTSMLESPLLPRIGIEPIRGQMLCFASRPFLIKHVIYGPRGYLVPRHDGRLLAGSTAEAAGFDKRVTEEGIETIKSMAAQLSPHVVELPLMDSWAGFRPRSGDDLPVLGPTSTVKGLFYATGHYRNGILLAPITGELIADAVIGESMSCSLSSFSPDRFLPR